MSGQMFFIIPSNSLENTLHSSPKFRYGWDKRGKDAPRLPKAELAEKQMEDEWLDLQSEFKSSEEYWKVESWM